MPGLDPGIQPRCSRAAWIAGSSPATTIPFYGYYAVGSAGLRQVLGDEFPIHQMVEEGLHEIRPAVLVIEIIGVLPDVAGEQRRLAFGQRVDRVRRRCNLELAAFGNEPAPAAAELTDGRCLELLLELVETAAVAVDRLRYRAGPGAAAVRLHAVPEEGVVPHLRGVVEQARLRAVLVARL